MARKNGEVKTERVQQGTFVKGLVMKCKVEQQDDEEQWQMPEMVGFYSEATLPIAPVQTADEVRLSIKKVVCSPDLPIGEYPGNRGAAHLHLQHHQHQQQQQQQQQHPQQQQQQQHQQQNVQCQVCRKMYTTKAALQAHQRTHAKDAEDPYRCNICSKTFAVPARLTRHYRTHTGEKPFRCEFCNKSFSVKENLSVHRRIHTKERPYKCEVCSRAFEHSGKLHRHMRIHTGERPHKCNVCAKTFIQSGQLVIHMRTHTGEKPYVCTVCQKGFTCSKQLKVHSRTHTGEKPYSCEICGKSFGYNHVLKLHQVAHYGEKVYKCTICNDTFNSKKSMEAHIKSHSDGGVSAVVVGPPPSVPTPPASSISSSDSCSSLSLSDKENNKDSPAHVMQEPMCYESDIRYYIQHTASRAASLSPQPAGHPQAYILPASGVELLAAAATATEREEKYRPSPEVVFDIIKGPQELLAAAAALRHPAYFTAASSAVQYAPLNAGDDIRRRVEAALAVEEIPSSEEEPAMTPPSSAPVSPAPSVSPPPVSPPVSPDPELSLPPRKRSRMILKSMESSIDLSPVRYSSVIQYARAS